MASLGAQNPHSQSKNRGLMGGDGDFIELEKRSVQERWRKASGDAVADDSKRILSVSHGSKRFIMADIRSIKVSGQRTGSIPLEFFFDGEVKDLGTNLVDFVGALRESLREGVNEYFRRKLKRSFSCGEMGEYRRLRYPEINLTLIGDDPMDAFRDAGCMLNFIAVRVSISEECAEAIGGIAFPEYFGMKEGESKDDQPIPLWLWFMAIVALIMSLATVYAWSHILILGNRTS